MLQIKLTSVMVDDQDKALAFYTEVLGFPATTSSSRSSRTATPAARAFQQAMFEQKIPLTALESTDLDADHARLSAKGVAFTQPPTVAGPVKIAVLSDTVGNLIQLYQAR